VEVRLELGNFDAADDLARAALADETRSDLAGARARRCLAKLHRRLHQQELAKQELEEAVKLAEGHQTELIQVLRDLAVLQSKGTSDRGTAVKTVNTAIQWCLDDPENAGWLLPSVYRASSMVHQNLGSLRRSEEAIVLGRKALAPDQRLFQAWLAHREARVHLARGRYKEARQRGFEAIEAFAGMRHRYGKAHCRLVIGEAYLAEGQDEQARQVLEEALENFINCGDRWAEVEVSRLLTRTRTYPVSKAERLQRAATLVIADLRDTEGQLVRERLAASAPPENSQQPVPKPTFGNGAAG
jgi:tetratricopeptide (TPR) repeat protein